MNQWMETYQGLRIMIQAGALVEDSRGWEWAGGGHQFFLWKTFLVCTYDAGGQVRASLALVICLLF